MARMSTCDDHKIILGDTGFALDMDELRTQVAYARRPMGLGAAVRQEKLLYFGSFADAFGRSIRPLNGGSNASPAARWGTFFRFVKQQAILQQSPIADQFPASVTSVCEGFSAVAIQALRLPEDHELAVWLREAETNTLDRRKKNGETFESVQPEAPISEPEPASPPASVIAVPAEKTIAPPPPPPPPVSETQRDFGTFTFDPAKLSARVFAARTAATTWRQLRQMVTAEICPTVPGATDQQKWDMFVGMLRQEAPLKGVELRPGPMSGQEIASAINAVFGLDRKNISLAQRIHGAGRNGGVSIGS